LDEAMSVTGVSAKERAETLERYPSSAGKESLSAMPANLVYQLALTRAEAGQYEEALVLFKDRFFPSEEGGVSSAQVLFEIRLMQAEAEAASGSCAEAGDFLAASHPGLEVNGAVSEAHLRMAAIAKECQHPQLSEQLLQKAAASGGGVDSAWVAKAQKLLGTYDAMEQRQILQASLAAAERVKDTSAFTGWWYYNIGTIQAALNHRDQAKEAFNKALLLPDSMMSHHMSRAAIADLSTDKSSY
jgi:tetratricopeptide (TPR) repeat protein